jgi:hypothetical protein
MGQYLIKLREASVLHVFIFTKPMSALTAALLHLPFKPTHSLLKLSYSFIQILHQKRMSRLWVLSFHGFEN